jgi:hypothetical protein
VAGLADLNIRKACNPFSFDIAVAEGTVQLGHLFVVDVIEADGLFDCDSTKDWKDSKERGLGLNLKTVVSHNGNEEKHEDRDHKINPFLHDQVYSNPFHPVFLG